MGGAGPPLSMTKVEPVYLFPILFLIVTLGVALSAVVSKDNREVWGQIRPRQYGLLFLLAPLGIIVSLLHFAAVEDHAWRPHEESLWFALTGDADADGIPDSSDQDIDGDGTPNTEDPINDVYHPLEIQPLLRVIYRGVGAIVGADPVEQRPTWDNFKYAFMGTAILLGMWATMLFGITGQLLTGRFAIGLGAGLLLVVNPTLAYWRVHAFHVAIAHVAFSATLLAAVLVARRQSTRNYAAWLILGSMTLYLRPEQVGAVLGTAAIPLLCSSVGFWALLSDWKRWTPGLVVGVGLLAPHTFQMYQLAVGRQDYRTGARFAALHLQIRELWEPMILPGFTLLIILGILAGILPKMRRPDWIGKPARALSIIAVMGLLPSLFFTSFGARHLLNTGSACSLLALLGLALVHASFKTQGARLSAVIVVGFGVGCLGPVVWNGLDKLEDWGGRYSVSQSEPPALPNTARPEAKEPAFNPQACGTYAAEWKLCNQETWPWCHPPKDLRDPVLIRQRWDMYDGCVVWGIDELDGRVAGARHEWWMVVRELYSWKPLGIIQVSDEGLVRQVDVYRMTERP